MHPPQASGKRLEFDPSEVNFTCYIKCLFVAERDGFEPEIPLAVLPGPRSETPVSVPEMNAAKLPMRVEYECLSIGTRSWEEADAADNHLIDRGSDHGEVKPVHRADVAVQHFADVQSDTNIGKRQVCRFTFQVANIQVGEHASSASPKNSDLLLARRECPTAGITWVKRRGDYANPIPTGSATGRGPVRASERASGSRPKRAKAAARKKCEIG
jgi:hypothetical protein